MSLRINDETDWRNVVVGVEMLKMQDLIRTNLVIWLTSPFLATFRFIAGLRSWY